MEKTMLLVVCVCFFSVKSSEVWLSTTKCGAFLLAVAEPTRKFLRHTHSICFYFSLKWDGCAVYCPCCLSYNVLNVFLGILKWPRCMNEALMECYTRWSVRKNKRNRFSTAFDVVVVVVPRDDKSRAFYLCRSSIFTSISIISKFKCFSSANRGFGFWYVLICLVYDVVWYCES